MLVWNAALGASRPAVAAHHTAVVRSAGAASCPRADPPTTPADFPFSRNPATRPLPEAAISTRRQQARRQLLGLLGATGACSAQQDPSSALPAGATLAAAMEGAEGPAGPGRPPLHSGAEEGGVLEGGAGVDALTAGAAYCPAVLVRHDPPGTHSVPGGRWRHAMRCCAACTRVADWLVSVGMAAERQLHRPGAGGCSPAACALVSRTRPHSGAGWSLVVPGGWVQHFWQALAFAGAKPAGQREWRWAATLQGRPFFPHDFPDTQVCACRPHAPRATRARALRWPSHCWPVPRGWRLEFARR